MLPNSIIRLDEFLSGLPPERLTTYQIAPSRRWLNRPPRFVLGDVPAQLSLSMLGELTVAPIRCYALDGISVGEDGMLFDGEHALAAPSLNLPDYHVADLLGRDRSRGIARTSRRLDGSFVWLTGPGYHIYGHWLIDFLPRLVALERAGFDLAGLRYLLSGPPAPFTIPLLAAFGIGPQQLVFIDNRNEIAHVERLFVASNVRHGSRLHPIFSEFKDRLIERAAIVSPAVMEPSEGHGKLFISRQEAEQARVVLNRDAIERIATDHGFAVVRPEGLRMAEQIRLFLGARQIAGEYGSGLHGVVFARPGAVTCALRSTALHPGFIQSSIADVCRQSVGYVFSPTPLDGTDHAFEVSESDMETGLQCLELAADEPWLG